MDGQTDGPVNIDGSISEVDGPIRSMETSEYIYQQPHQPIMTSKLLWDPVLIVNSEYHFRIYTMSPQIWHGANDSPIGWPTIWADKWYRPTDQQDGARRTNQMDRQTNKIDRRTNKIDRRANKMNRRTNIIDRQINQKDRHTNNYEPTDQSDGPTYR